MYSLPGRRRFLRNTARTALTMLGAGAIRSIGKTSAEAPKGQPMIPILDTHQHLWDLKKFRLPWIKKDSPLARSFLTSDYERATEGLNVVKTIYMEVDLDPAQQTEEARHVIELCQAPGSKMAAAVISGRPASDSFPKYIQQFKNSKQIKGVRQVLHVPATPPGYCLNPTFVKNIGLLGELGMSFDICVRPAELVDAAKLVGACPGTRFILDHCGNPLVTDKDHTQWRRDIAALAEHKNIVGKISGIVISAKPGMWSAADLAPIVNHVVSVFGKDRVMFGGDWPVCTQVATYREWLEALQTIVADWTEVDRRKLFYDNAAKFYLVG